MQPSNINKSTSKATQTLFRTLSKNNYVLEEMIDRKAHIMITTNAIVISIILGSTLCQTVIHTVDYKLILLLLSVWVTSIVLALYAIKPFLVKPKDLNWKDHNLLNFHTVQEMNVDEYRSRFFTTLKSEHDIYNAMIEDIYHLSRNIKRKHRFLAYAAYTFLLGILIVVFIYAHASNLFPATDRLSFIQELSMSFTS